MLHRAIVGSSSPTKFSALFCLAGSDQRRGCHEREEHKPAGGAASDHCGAGLPGFLEARSHSLRSPGASDTELAAASLAHLVPSSASEKGGDSRDASQRPPAAPPRPGGPPAPRGKAIDCPAGPAGGSLSVSLSETEIVLWSPGSESLGGRT